MSEYVTTTLGLFPLPDWAKEDLSALKGHQKHDLISGDEGDEVAVVYERARAEVIDTQTDAGLDLVVEGQLRWDDMLAHPLCVHDAVETRGLQRYYDNNNFYREPVITGALTPDGDVAAELGSARERTDELQAVCPGPYSLTDLATDEHYGDEAALLAAVAEFLAAEVGSFPAVEAVFLLEPSLVTNPPAADHVDGVERAVSTIVDSIDAPVVVQPYWGALEPRTHAALLDAGVDAIGYDLVTAPEASVEVIDEQGAPPSVALGVVDGQNTLIESPETIRDRLEWFDERTPDIDPETVYLTPNTELFYLPVSKFEAKVGALATAGTPEAVA